MIWLLLGLVLWYASHLFKRLAPGPRAAMGEKGKGPIALAAVAAIVLMVIGYRGWDDAAILWNAAPWHKPVNNTAMLVALYLYAASGMKARITRVIRHPQLLAVLVWSLAHLLPNGDMAGLVLFGGLALWSVLEMVLINRAEPRPALNPPAPIGKEIGAILGAVIVTGAIGWIHIWFGLSPFR
jgi:uncharacterized membrane protein